MKIKILSIKENRFVYALIKSTFMKKGIAFILLLFSQFSIIYSQTKSDSLNNNIYFELKSILGGGICMPQDNAGGTNSFPWSFDYKLAPSFTTGFSADINYWKLGVGFDALLTMNSIGIITPYGRLDFVNNNYSKTAETKSWTERYYYLTLPIYLKFNTYHGGAFKFGLAQEILLHSNSRGYFGDKKYFDESEYIAYTSGREDAPSRLIDYYSDYKSVKSLYFGFQSRTLKNFSFGVYYQRPLEEFRHTNTVFLTDMQTMKIKEIEYRKNVAILSIQYRFKHKELGKNSKPTSVNC